jgi:redox-sensitive bicupin YhaK (pirin superfamily)
VTVPDQRVVVERADGSLGPLLRIAEDRLPPGGRYGGHEHRAVDVVAVVLSGSLTHEWNPPAQMSARDVGLLRAGSGLRHDERAGDGGVRVLQCYLRAADAGAAPSHVVRTAPEGWVDLQRGDARLWVGRGDDVAPPGLVLEVRGDEIAVSEQAGPVAATGADTVVVWELDVRRPDWARWA